MANMILQGARAAAPYLVNTASKIALSYAAQGISSLFGGAAAQGPRLGNVQLQTSRDGAPMPRLYGRYRLAGQVIWATRLKETRTQERVSSGGKGGGSTRVDGYSYSISFAIGLCEGEIFGLGQIWANGEVLSGGRIEYRLYKGSENQSADPLIQMIDGADAPAFRGTAYIVFEDFPLDNYGGRLPQINVEVFRQPASADDRPRMEDLIQGVNLIPGSGEYVYSPQPREEQDGPYNTRAINVNNLQATADVQLAIDQLEDQLPGCRSVSIIVSWFGDDLRCGSCKIRPGVESRERIMIGQDWHVGTYHRDNAALISHIDNQPIYGGTPSDDSLIELIQMLKSRGISVTLYPFILMDIDPDKGQPALPWRGRISTNESDQGAQASTQIAQFFGQCQPNDFSASGQSVTYSGPPEHSFRRMILHYAQLADLAGGVDSFIIGSEMRGLTTVRGLNHSYPAVTQFKALAADVRSIVGSQTQLSYAADWSEYFGHHADGDVHFHLDPLWSDVNIDAVGIDAYFPLSDWRAGTEHLDAQSAEEIYDLDYLKSNIEGGEGYDWYYASPADRNAQLRTAITDGLAGKDWVYRYKDLRNWWSQLHYNRQGGLENTSPTDWVPMSKPIWLTELGCPAVDKGSNQPNVFIDPKSSESAAPYFSSSERNDLIQRRYIEALLSYWGASENNPASSLYEGSMIDLSKAHIWCWDARPFPDFPARERIWSDGPNWTTGHWVSGRVGTALLSDIVSEIVQSSGAPKPDVSQLSGAVTGYLIDRPMSARAALEPLALIYGFDLIEGPNRMAFALHSGKVASVLEMPDLVLADRSAPLTHSLEDSEQNMRDVRLHYIDHGGDYQLGMQSVQNDAALTVNIMDIDAPMVLGPSNASLACRRLFGRALIGAERVQFSLAPHRLDLGAGDVITLPEQEGLWQIESLSGNRARRVSARRVSDGNALILAPEAPQISHDPIWTSLPQIIVLDIPALTAERSGPLIGVAASSYDEAIISCPQSQTTPQITLDSPAHIGRLITDLPAGIIWRRDHALTVRISLPAVSLSSLDDAAFFAGGNAIAVATSSGWEILQFQTAVLVAPDEYDISGFLRGQSGSAAQMDELVPAGAQIVWLGSGLKMLSLENNLRGADIELSVNVSGRTDVQTANFIYKAQHLIPYAPVHLRQHQQGDDLMLSWSRQTRFGGDDWASLEVPLSEETEQYMIEIWDDQAMLMSEISSAPHYVLDSVALAQLPSQLTVKVTQMSAIVGAGEVLAKNLTV